METMNKATMTLNNTPAVTLDKASAAPELKTLTADMSYTDMDSMDVDTYIAILEARRDENLCNYGIQVIPDDVWDYILEMVRDQYWEYNGDMPKTLLHPIEFADHIGAWLDCMSVEDTNLIDDVIGAALPSFREVNSEATNGLTDAQVKDTFIDALKTFVSGHYYEIVATSNIENSVFCAFRDEYSDYGIGVCYGI